LVFAFEAASTGFGETTMRFLGWLTARLQRSRAARAVIAIALVLPSLVCPRFIDEYVQEARWKAALDSVSA
jgi:hypothetical protein